MNLDSRTWAFQLRPASLLLVDEVPDIQTINTIFRTYLDAAERLLKGIGGDLYVGRCVERLCRISSRLVRNLAVTAVCARMFRANLNAWGSNRHAGLSADDISHLATALDDLAGSTTSNEIHWQMRQIIFKATTGG